jgi:hypothetical protein
MQGQQKEARNRESASDLKKVRTVNSPYKTQECSQATQLQRKAWYLILIK